MMEDGSSSSNSMELENSDFYMMGSSSMDHDNDSSSLIHTGSDGGSDHAHFFEFVFGPTLESATATLRWAFWLHTYGFGCLFFFLAFYSFFSILNLRSQLSARPYMTTINSFLCLLGASRCAVLFIDPYGLEQRLPILICSLLWDMGFPSLISSFSLIQIAFLQLTQYVPQHKLCRNSPTEPLFIVSEWNSTPFWPVMVDLGPETFRKKTCLSLVITLHFISAIISAIYSSLNSDLMAGKMVTQLLFAMWGFLLCGSFLVAGKQVLHLLSGGSSSSGSCTGGSTNDKGIANLFGMGMMNPGGGQNLASSLTAALAPTLLQGSSSSSTSGVGTSGGATSSSAASSMNSSGKDGSSSSSSKDAPKIKITDEHDHTVSTSDSSRLNDIPELPEGNNGPSSHSHHPPPLVASPRSSFSGQGGGGEGEGSSSSGSTTYVRPPSPVFPRRKSSGAGLRGGVTFSSVGGSGPRRLSWNRKDSGGGELLSTCPPSAILAGGENKEVRKKSLTWCEESVERVSAATEKRRASRKSFDASATSGIDSERNGVTETLLVSSTTTEVGADYTLQSILSHIAYVNQTALDYRLSRKLSRTNQVHKVVKYTSYTAALGVVVCVGELVRLMSPLGLLASQTGAPPSIWLWFILHTLCRAFEFAMGATVANITTQPVNRPPHYAYSFRHKHHRDSSLYL